MSRKFSKIPPSEGIAFNRVNGLVDLNDYARFLPDDSDSVPLAFDTKVPYEERKWVNQHVYFVKGIYWQIGGEANELSQSPYNQIIMRPDQERLLHSTYENHVEPPPIDAIRPSLADFSQLDRLGAALVGRQIAINPLWAPGNETISTPNQATEKVNGPDRLDYFGTEIETILASLENPLITPLDIVASAIKRLSMRFGDHSITPTLNEGLAGNPRYPLKLPKFHALVNLSHRMLAEANMKQSVEDQAA